MYTSGRCTDMIRSHSPMDCGGTGLSDDGTCRRLPESDFHWVHLDQTRPFSSNVDLDQTRRWMTQKIKRLASSDGDFPNLIRAFLQKTECNVGAVMKSICCESFEWVNLAHELLGSVPSAASGYIKQPGNRWFSRAATAGLSSVDGPTLPICIPILV